MKALSSPAKKATGLPISFSGAPMRRKGMIFSMIALSVGSASEAGDWALGVKLFTLILCLGPLDRGGAADRLDRGLHPRINAIVGRRHDRAAAEIDDAATPALLHVRM